MRKLDWLTDVPAEDSHAKHLSFWKHLSEHAYPISRGTMRIPISLEPFGLTAGQHADTSAMLLLLINAAQKIAQNYFIDSALQEVLAIDEAERELIVASKDQPFVGVIRAYLLYGSGPRALELNADFPDGIFMHDVTSQAIADSSPLALSSASNAALFDELLRLEGVSSEDHIFIAYNAGREFVDEFELTRIVLARFGWNVSVGTFDDLVFKGGKFYAAGMPVSVLRRGSELSKLRHNKKLLSELIEAQQNGLKIINNFKMRLLGHKALFAALWDERFQHYLTLEEIEAVQSLVPYTKKLEEFEHHHLAPEKDRWVLKPTDLAEGNGITVGTTANEDEWARALAEAFANPRGWIVQEKAILPESRFTFINDDTGERTHARAFHDLNPHVILSREKASVGNILVRFSNSEILNVMKGGGITYAFVADEL